MVKPLSFKGDKKPSKKRKRPVQDDVEGEAQSKDRPSTSISIDTKPKSPPPRRVQDDNDIEEDDSWVSAEQPDDISGPILLILPTEPRPSALATDATGKVFPLAVQLFAPPSPSPNQTSDSHIQLDAAQKEEEHFDPNASEPHDVRMVWVGKRIVGASTFTFRNQQSRYLSCAANGQLSATREAVGHEEQFNIIMATPLGSGDGIPGLFAIQSSEYSTFIGFGPPPRKVKADDDANSSKNKTPLSITDELRGSFEFVEYASSLRVRMQARFKPKLRVAKKTKADEKISRRQLEEMVGRKLEDDEVKLLKKARKEGNFHEKLLDIKVKGKHDKFG